MNQNMKGLGPSSFLQKNELTRLGISRELQKDYEFFKARFALLSGPLNVFLLGGTGSGKSTIFNLLAGRELVKTGVVRPTSTRVSVLSHEKHKGALQGLDLDFISGSPSDFEEMTLWDFPDFDSYMEENHRFIELLREYADLMILVLHPEKYKQENLLKTLELFPEVRRGIILTHGDTIPKHEIGELQEELSLLQNLEFARLFDVIHEGEELRKEVFQSLRRIRDSGIPFYKSTQMEELRQRISKDFSVVREKTRERIEKLGSELSAMKECTDLAKGVIEGVSYDIYKAGVYEENSQRCLDSLLSRSGSYYSFLLGFLKGFVKPSKTAQIPYLSLPYLRLEEELSGKVLLKLPREVFQKRHHDLLEVQRSKLLKESQKYGFYLSGLDLVFDFLLPLGLGIYMVFELPSYPYSFYLNLIVLVSYIGLGFLFFFLRMKNRLKRDFNRGAREYEDALGEFCVSLLQEEKESLETELQELEDLEKRLP